MIKALPLLVVLLFLAALVSFRGQIVSFIKEQQLKGSSVISELNSKTFLDQIEDADGKYDSLDFKAVWFNRPVEVPMMELAAQIVQNPELVLGQTTANPNKWIEVDLSKQRLYAHDGDQIVYNMPVSTGLPWLPTVTGDFRIWAKVRSQRMTGGQVANGTYYNLPNVPYVQYFYGGYGLHGTYWHNDFGRPRSHGCVNLSIPDAEKLFYWTDPQLPSDRYSQIKITPSEATRIVVHGTTPTTL